MFTSLRRVTGVFLVSGAAALAASPAAAAHVDAKLVEGVGPGGFGVVTLGVPTEALFSIPWQIRQPYGCAVVDPQFR